MSEETRPPFRPNPAPKFDATGSAYCLSSGRSGTFVTSDHEVGTVGSRPAWVRASTSAPGATAAPGAVFMRACWAKAAVGSSRSVPPSSSPPGSPPASFATRAPATVSAVGLTGPGLGWS
ncbi:hypothetical protein ABT063_06265 [Streptomyces sp. NPDC002838]|uniref:hypothetical protein n=1 Tax=Streptomyces sp. NPDC002838 TaxID=3154436 RepID=UPI003331B6A9